MIEIMFCFRSSSHVHNSKSLKCSQEYFHGNAGSVQLTIVIINNCDLLHDQSIRMVHYRVWYESEALIMGAAVML